MTIRDLDLVIAALLMGVATILSRVADAALAITILGLLIALAVTLLGEDRIEALWREYCREPPTAAPRPRKTVPALPPRRGSERDRSREPRRVGLASARVVPRDDRGFVRVA